MQGGGVGGGEKTSEAASRAPSLEQKTARESKHSYASPWLIVSLMVAAARIRLKLVPVTAMLTGSCD